MLIKTVTYSVNTLLPARIGRLMDMIQVLGLVAGACTSIASAPQVVKAWKTKYVKDVSKKMFILLALGTGLWLVYGIFKSDIPIIVTNAVSVACNSIMLLLKIRYQKLPQNNPDK